MRVLARALERGLPSGRVLDALAGVWAKRARVERRVVVDAALGVITVGGATLGGSGKTPLAVALARHAASRGARVVLVSHAYKADAAPGEWVTVDDDAAKVGDEALASARSLDHARVVSGSDRQACLDLAATWAELVVVDGVCQLTPRRADWAVLAVDHDAPWGAGVCPPRGDLRAPRQALLEAVDTVVSIRTDGCAPEGDEASWRVRGAVGTRDGRRWSLDELRATPFALVTNCARPGRVRATLESHGVAVTRHVELADHARGPLHVKDRCLVPTKLARAANWPRSAWIDADLVLSAAVAARVDRLVAGPDGARRVP